MASAALAMHGGLPVRIDRRAMEARKLQWQLQRRAKCRSYARHSARVHTCVHPLLLCVCNVFACADVLNNRKATCAARIETARTRCERCPPKPMSSVVAKPIGPASPRCDVAARQRRSQKLLHLVERIPVVGPRNELCRHCLMARLVARLRGAARRATIGDPA